jgi:two-component system, LytTR family, response regulator
MIQCIAVDDEPLALELLADNISKIPYLKLVAKCSDAFEATQVLQQQPVDLVFIDIQMPGLTGLQFIGSLVKKPMVILVTAYKQYALEGYDLQVVDYLLKPVSIERFVKACNKAQELYQLKNPVSQQAPEYLFVNVGYSLQKIVLDDIAWIEGLKDYIQIHLNSTPKPVLVRLSVKAMEEQLPAQDFIRIHKSYIVAVKSVTALRKNSVFIGERELSVGETYAGVTDRFLR